MSSLLSLMLETADPRPESLSKISGRSKEEVEIELSELLESETLLVGCQS